MEEIKGLICRRIIPVLSILAMLGLQPAAAQDNPDRPGKACEESCLKDRAQKLVGQLFSYPKKFGLVAIEHITNQARPSLYYQAPPEPYPAGPTQWDMDKFTFRDNTTLVGQLRGLEDVSLITFWENDSTKLYLGVSRDGIAGINIRQKRHKRPSNRDSGSKHSKLDAPPVIHDPYALLAAN